MFPFYFGQPHDDRKDRDFFVPFCKILFTVFYKYTNTVLSLMLTDTDRRYRATEKLLHAEEEYLEALCSAKELYARPLARNYPEFHDVIFQPLADLSVVTSEHCQRVSFLAKDFHN